MAHTIVQKSGKYTAVITVIQFETNMASQVIMQTGLEYASFVVFIVISTACSALVVAVV